MKKFLAFLLLCSSFVFTFEGQRLGDPLLVVLLMVKNEEAVMEGTLKPFLEAGIDSYLILDTGSTDNTIAVTQDLFQKYSVQRGYVEEQPFVDFATSRNYAIKKAEERFPNANFFLMIDAEWYTYNVEGLLEFCKHHVDDFMKAFGVAICQKNGKKQLFYQRRLFKPHRGIYFTGVVHEILNYQSDVYSAVPKDIYFLYDPTDVGQEKSKNRWVRDRDLLLKEQEEHPDNPRTLYYLGQTYECLQDLQNAITWYTKTYDRNDVDEFSYVACYRLGCIYEQLQNFDKAIFYYLKAFELHPVRAESLVRLSQYYLKNNNYAECYKYAYAAANIEMPEVGLFIEAELYNYTRYAMLSAVAVCFGKYEIGRWATLKALEVYPNDKHLLDNLEQYTKLCR